MKADYRAKSFALTAVALGRKDGGFAVEGLGKAESAEDAIALRAQKKSVLGARGQSNLVVHVAEQTDDSPVTVPSSLRCSLEQVDSLFHLTVHLPSDVILRDSPSVHATLVTEDSLVLHINGIPWGIRLPDELRGQINPGE
jgi:hypothetical protein